MKLAFCLECAAPLSKHSDTDYICTNGHHYWNNPRSACSIVFINKQGKVLYSKRRNEPQKGKYDLPGGFCEYGENAYQAAVREAQEETGAIVQIGDLYIIDSIANIYDKNIATCDTIFVCRHWQGELAAADDVDELKWLPIDFIASPGFAWNYRSLVAKLQKFLEN